MLNYRILIFGNGCFRSWVLLLLLLPFSPALASPFIFILFAISLFVLPPIYCVVALEEWVFRLVIESAKTKGRSWESILNRLLVASLLAPALLGTLILLPPTLFVFGPLLGVEGVLRAVGVVTAALTVASVVVMAVRKRAILGDILDHA